MTHLGEARLLPKKNIWIAPPARGDGYMGGGIIALLLKLVLFFCFPAPNHLSANMILLFVCFESCPAYLTISFRWQTFFIVCWLSVLSTSSILGPGRTDKRSGSFCSKERKSESVVWLLQVKAKKHEDIDIWSTLIYTQLLLPLPIDESDKWR